MQKETLELVPINETWLGLKASSVSIIHELSDELTFMVPGAQFSPAFKKGFWDGKIRLVKKNRVYKGLLSYIKNFCEERGYECDSSEIDLSNNFPDSDITEFLNNLNPSNEKGEKIVPYDYQLDGFNLAVNNKRKTILSATASGKSLIIYMIMRFYLENLEGNFLLIVPNVSLVEQMFNDFKEYSQLNGFDVEKHCCKVYSGKDKNTGKRITISTWQSLFKMPKEYLEQFTLMVGDECHTQKSKETSGLIENLVNCSHRYGFTGTLDNEKIHELVIYGLFGDIVRISKTSELIQEGKLSDMMINCITFSYTEEECRLVCKNDWEHEVQFINSHEKRTEFIVNLAHSLSGNCLIVFSRVEKHGKIIFEKLQEASNKNVYFISGKVKAAERESIRQAVENSENNIIVATSQIFAQGINIKSLQHIIFAHPSKARIRLIQSIGRVLRKSERKSISYVHDLSDNLCSKNKKNYSYKHYKERLKMYIEEEFPYRMFEHKLLSK